MQQYNNKQAKLKYILGQNIQQARIDKQYKSLNKFAREYDINRANLSKIERGEVGCSFIMAWRISEALGIKLSDFVKQLEDCLGSDFKLMDE